MCLPRSRPQSEMETWEKRGARLIRKDSRGEEEKLLAFNCGELRIAGRNRWNSTWGRVQAGGGTKTTNFVRGITHFHL